MRRKERALPIWAHPRSRGEHSPCLICCRLRRGSSPLARGTCSAAPVGATGKGLIPARAGNIVRVVWEDGDWRAHPRSRGEHAFHRGSKPPGPGSSPLARGTFAAIYQRAGHRGLIPARAGNISILFASSCWLRAHPRSRGEHRTRPGTPPANQGSSPLARGTFQLSKMPTFQEGLIPARAGNILADMGFYPLHQQNRITLEPEPASRIHDKQ